MHRRVWLFFLLPTLASFGLPACHSGAARPDAQDGRSADGAADGAAGSAAGTGGGTAGGNDGGAGHEDADVDADVNANVDAPVDAPNDAALDELDDCMNCLAGCAGNTCACDGICAPAVPAGWSGPASTGDITEFDHGCQDANYPNAILAGQLPQATQAACTCACGGCTGGACDVYDDQYSTSDCSGPADATSLVGTSVNECGSSTASGALHKIHGVASTAAATCGATKTSVSLPAPTWGKQFAVCTGPPNPGTCANAGVCMPYMESAHETWVHLPCIFHLGIVACPDSYPNEQIEYMAFNDTRDCSCSCNPSSATCEPQVSLVDTSAGCTGDTGTPFAQCGVAQSASTHGFRITSLDVTVSGTPTSTTTGGVTPAAPITVCCQ